MGSNYDLSFFLNIFFFQTIVVLWSHLCSFLSGWLSSLRILFLKGTGLIPGITSLFGLGQGSVMWLC